VRKIKKPATYSLGFRDTDTFLLSRLRAIGEGDHQFEDEIMELMSECFEEHKKFFDFASVKQNLSCTKQHCEIHVRFYKLVGCFKNIGAPRLARILETAEMVFVSKKCCEDVQLARQFFKQVKFTFTSILLTLKANEEWREFSARVDEYKKLRSFHKYVTPIPMSVAATDNVMVTLIQGVWRYWGDKAFEN
jgi:hypothetical protein